MRTGRSARFLKGLGAQQVYAVDHDQNMISHALTQELDGVTFLRIDGLILLPDASVDGAGSMNVFIEIRTLAAMTGACAEIARTLRPDAPFVLESSCPMAFGYTFRNFSYPQPGPCGARNDSVNRDHSRRPVCHRGHLLDRK